MFGYKLIKEKEKYVPYAINQGNKIQFCTPLYDHIPPRFLILERNDDNFIEISLEQLEWLHKVIGDALEKHKQGGPNHHEL